MPEIVANKKNKPVITGSLSTIALTALLCMLCCLSSCVSKEAYQSAVEKNASLDLEMATQRQQLAELGQTNKTLKQQIAECVKQKTSVEQQVVEAHSEVERQADIYRARQVAATQQLQQLQQRKQQLEQEQQAAEQRYEQLKAVNQEQSATIVELENKLQREQLARKARLAKMANTYKKLVGSLEDEIHRGEVTISKLKNRLSVNLVQEILFPSGSAQLSTTGKKVIRQVGKILKDVADKDIRVEGHSDDRKIRPGLQKRFPSNWELSAARAANVVRFLQKEVGIPGKKLGIGAYGPYRPVADNSTAEGRAKNRRIQIVLVPVGQ